MSYMENLAYNLKNAKGDIANASTQLKTSILLKIADELEKSSAEIIKANEIDLNCAAQNGIDSIMIDRLALSKERIKAIAQSVRKVAKLPDPIGEVIEGFTRPNGLKILKQRVPIGSIGIIYESRPNVTVDAAALCIKTSNAVMLKGGKEALNTNIALIKVIHNAIIDFNLNPNFIALVEDNSREVTNAMMKLNGYLDLLIPRGGAGLIQAVVKNATIPVIETGTGNCHIYVDKYADLDKAVLIVNNAKTSRPSVCNACESLLVHKDVAKEFLPKMKQVFDIKNVIILGCEKTKEILGDSVHIATETDYATEFLGYVISVKVVDDVEDAVKHIEKYSTGHSEAIITNNLETSNYFTEHVNSAAVYVNASTRFTDGEEFGFGAEIGISTQKLHARGPMGLKELTSYKYVIYGNGQIR